MKPYAIVYCTKTGNTELLANALHDTLDQQACAYAGPLGPDVPTVGRVYAGFWTNRGTCPEEMAAYLRGLRNCEVFLFGTAGFGGGAAYFDRILAHVTALLDKSVTVLGTFMCQGKMPSSVRDYYEQMASRQAQGDAPERTADDDGSQSGRMVHRPDIKAMLANFDRALSHPDAEDLTALVAAARKTEQRDA